MTVFVLVHGGWHTGEAWTSTADELRRRRHEVHHPTVGGNRPGDSPYLTHADACTAIVDYITDHDLSEIVLVGHSYGGSIISKVAERLTDRIARLVYQNALVCKNGNCVLDELPAPLQQAFRDSAKNRGDGYCFFPIEVWSDLFIQDAPIELARKTYADLVPHPISTLTEKLDLTKFYSLNVPTSYINATDDLTLAQDPAYGWHPQMSSRLGPQCRIVHLPGSHEVMYTRPAELASAIDQAART